MIVFSVYNISEWSELDMICLAFGGSTGWGPRHRVDFVMLDKRFYNNFDFFLEVT